MRTVWIARHAARLDTVLPQWKKQAEYPHDTPLSPGGHSESIDLSDEVMGLGIDHLICSPFLRTRQTAAYCAESLKLKMRIEPGLHEWINIPGEVKIQNYVPCSSIDLTYIPVWEKGLRREEKHELDHRMIVVARKLLKKFEGNLLLISHGSPCKSLIEALSGNLTPMPELAKLYRIDIA